METLYAITSFAVVAPRDVTINPLLGETVAPLIGSNGGAGSQGSANTAHLAGHAGTAASQAGLPRQLKNGGSWVAQV